MNRDQLEHAIRAACDVSGDTELWVFGSQAILAQYPNAPEGLRASVEVDVQPKNRPEAVDAVDANLGELSRFNQTHGFYVHGVAIESARLPEGWQERTVPVRDPVSTRNHTGFCLEAHDLAASKLVAYREKDRDFVRLLLIEEMVEAPELARRIKTLEVDEDVKARLLRWVDITSEELEDSV